MALLLVFAVELEAIQTIAVLKAKKIKENLYRFSQGWILISGLGMLASLLSFLTLKQSFSKIWNLGFAGHLNDHLLIGSFLEVKSVEKFNFLPDHLDTTSKEMSNRLFPKIDLQEKGARLVTSDFPIHCSHFKQKWLAQYDLVDMEGYAIASASQFLKIPCQITKIISDFSSQEGRLLIKKHQVQLSHDLAIHVQKKIDRSWY